MPNDDDLLPEGSMDLPGNSEQPLPHLKSSQNKKIRPKRVLYVIILVVVAAALFAFVTYKNRQVDQADSLPVGTTPTVTENESSDFSDVPQVAETKVFKSGRPRLELTYPTSWQISENDGGIKLESKEFTYKSTTGEQIKGNFRIYIRQGARSEDSDFIGRGLAIKASEQIDYDDPVVGQRTTTNLSFFGLDSTDHFAYFFVAGNFSLDVGQSLGPDFGKEPEAYVITGGYSSAQLTKDMETNKVPLDYFQTTRAYDQAVNIVKSLKLL